ncbi:MAG: hypothetical protein RMJ56_13660 [Gemmataceae bacterium]|nr:hypothetical protein [Gemmata sp.]MDW8198638.1 hypothetical protein [Gemmataceae bacterium]
MPWVIGIDEAGYGPSLGPLVQAAVAWPLPEGDLAGWTTLQRVVRRRHEKRDHRLLIDDSKKVYAHGGLAALEEGVWALWGQSAATLSALIGPEASPENPEGFAEPWFDPGERLPTVIDGAGAWAATAPFRDAIGQRWASAIRLVTTAAFNRIVTEAGTKAAVLSRGWITLLDAVMRQLPHDDEPVHVISDKHGGRNYYAALVQQAFPDRGVATEMESAAESRYRVDSRTRVITITFRPRADGDSVTVALASMLCKYLREVCMRQFNRYWLERVPGLRPTAGYPVDAQRFFAEIQPALEKLGLTRDHIWRQK